MNIHKFNTKPKEKQNKTIKWMIPTDIRQYVKKVNGNTWKIFSQENIKLKPKEVKHLFLGIGFMMSEGVVLTSLANSLSEKGICDELKRQGVLDTNSYKKLNHLIKK